MAAKEGHAYASGSQGIPDDTDDAEVPWRSALFALEYNGAIRARRIDPLQPKK